MSCAPPSPKCGPWSSKCFRRLGPGAIVTDVGSVKGSVVRDLEPLVARAGAHFVGSHPMAGAEKMGVAAARADLFVGAVCVVTPTQKSNRAAVRKVEQLWKSVGARLLRLTPEAHDDLVSRSSHLPHVVAAQLARLILSPGHPKEQGMLCANGFRDTTRIASSSPEMWRDIALANRSNLSRALETFTAGLQEFRRALKSGDAQAILEFFEQARERRERWSRRQPALCRRSKDCCPCPCLTSSKSSRSTSRCGRRSPCRARRASLTGRWSWRRLARAKRPCRARSGARTPR